MVMDAVHVVHPMVMAAASVLTTDITLAMATTAMQIITVRAVMADFLDHVLTADGSYRIFILIDLLGVD